MCHLRWQICQGGHFGFLISPKIHKLGRGRCDLASCQVSINSIQRFQRASKNVFANKRPGDHLWFPISLKNANLVADVENLLPVNLCGIQFSDFEGEVEKCVSQSEAGRPSWFSNPPQNLVEVVETLLPIKFRQILFSGYRGKVKYVSAKQRPGAHLGFLSARKTYKLGRGRCVLAVCEVSSNSVQWFQRRSRKCVNQSWCPDRPDKHNLVKEVETLFPFTFRQLLFTGFRGAFSSGARQHTLY